MEVMGSIYTGVTADFQRGVYPIARCVKAEQHDLGVVMRDVNILGSLEAKFESTNRIYDVGGGCSPTLSTMQGGNQEPKILESQIVAMRGRNQDNPSDRTSGIPTEQRLEPNMSGTSNCLTSVQKDNLVLEPKYRIRKLTPRECGRLMGVSDEDISKMAAVNSNTQLYKQFGNSIVVDVMCAMFKNLNIEQVSETRN